MQAGHSQYWQPPHAGLAQWVREEARTGLSLPARAALRGVLAAPDGMQNASRAAWLLDAVTRLLPTGGGAAVDGGAADYLLCLDAPTHSQAPAPAVRAQPGQPGVMYEGVFRAAQREGLRVHQLRAAGGCLRAQFGRRGARYRCPGAIRR